MKRNISLEIIKYNNNIQKRLNISINDYKSILIEIIPVQNKYNKFINVKKEDKKYFHIYFNDNKEEIKRIKLNRRNKVSKINVVIDYQVNSFNELFQYCFIESINFKKFYRNNITDMSFMFDHCSSLKEINLYNFNTNNVKDMGNMFYECSSLKELNLSNFNTNNVTNMSDMFSYCSSLKELNLSNFNTNNVKDMSDMFYECSSLKELNISNFNTNNVKDMRYMFSGCGDELKSKIRSKYENFKEEAFDDFRNNYSSDDGCDSYDNYEHCDDSY